jgi:V/A-type H+-transporting ATPase subunit I
MENISTMLIAGIVSGVILIIMAMILNIKNGIKNKDKGKVLFDKNGVAGIVFYVSVLALIIEFVMTGKIIGGAVIVLLTIVLPIVLIMFKENIMSKIEKKKLKENSSLVEKIFEIVEMLLSFMSNTISFVRLAAFAINHVGLCLAVYVLAGLTSGAGSIAIAIIGNIIVIVLEGLIVAIQVLRLEYYELFSRFYAGDGREYKPIDELV